MHRSLNVLLKAGIAAPFLVSLVWVPLVAPTFSQRSSRPAAPLVVVQQPTPTEDATVAALSKEQLSLQIRQLQGQLQDQGSWLATNASALIAACTAILVALFGIFQWAATTRRTRDKEIEDRTHERQKEIEMQSKDLRDRAEERFQAAVTGLGNEKESSRIGAAILLRTFLDADYEQFHIQTFDLAVAHLRLPRTFPPPADPSLPQAMTPVCQTLITVFKEAYPLARKWKQDNPRFLDATEIHLEYGNLRDADLEYISMPGAFLQRADLFNANLAGALLTAVHLSDADGSGASLPRSDLSAATCVNAIFIGANLTGADLHKATLMSANLKEANLKGANLKGANLEGANLEGAILINADLEGANVEGANLEGADLERVNLERANLEGAVLIKANLKEARLNGATLANARMHGSKLYNTLLFKANLKGARLNGAQLGGAKLNGAVLEGAVLEGAVLKMADLRGAEMSGVRLERAVLANANFYKVHGLSKRQLIACKAKGARIDEDALDDQSPSAVIPSTEERGSPDTPVLA